MERLASGNDLPTVSGNGLPIPPYVSQWGDMACNVACIERHEDPSALIDWREQGYPSAASYSKWSRETCGLACLEEILQARDGKLPFANKWEYICRAVDQGVIKVTGDPASGDFETSGVIYQPFVEWVAHDFCLDAVSRPDLPILEAADLVASGAWYAILSVSYEIRIQGGEPTHTGGHLVLAFDSFSGQDGCSDRRRIVFHNSSGIAPTPDAPDRPNSAVAVALPIERFERFYAGRGILVRRETHAR